MQSRSDRMLTCESQGASILPQRSADHHIFPSFPSHLYQANCVASYLCSNCSISTAWETGCPNENWCYSSKASTFINCLNSPLAAVSKYNDSCNMWQNPTKVGRRMSYFVFWIISLTAIRSLKVCSSPGSLFGPERSRWREDFMSASPPSPHPPPR